MAKDTKGLEDKVDADHAKTGRLLSGTEDPADHSVSAGEIDAQVDPKGTSGATINAASIDKVNDGKDEKDAKRLEEDQSIAGKIHRSQLFFVRDHTTGEDYVGISPQNNPDASPASKRLSSVSTLGTVPPRTGMVVRPKDGPAFTVGEGYGPDSTPEQWAGVTNPETGKPLFG